MKKKDVPPKNGNGGIKEGFKAGDVVEWTDDGIKLVKKNNLDISEEQKTPLEVQSEEIETRLNKEELDLYDLTKELEALKNAKTEPQNEPEKETEDKKDINQNTEEPTDEEKILAIKAKIENTEELNDKEKIKEEDKKNRAYKIYQERGEKPGDEKSDWHQAEKELREENILAIKNKIQNTEEGKDKNTEEKSQPFSKEVLLGLETSTKEAREAYFEFKNNKPKIKESFWGKTKNQEEIELYEDKLWDLEDNYTQAKKEQIKYILNRSETEKAKEFLENGIVLDKEQEAREFIFQEKELQKANDLENGPLSARMIKGVSNGIKYWEEIGNNENDKKIIRILKKTGKTLAAVAIIGGAGAAVVSSFAAVGVGTAAAVTGGYFAKRIGMAVGFSSGIAILPDSLKPIAGKLMIGLSMTSIAGAAGFGVSKLGSIATKKWWSEEAIAKKSEENIRKMEINLETVETNFEELEEEAEKIIKEAEKKRVYRRLLAGTLALGTSVAFLEVTGHNMDTKAAEVKHNEEVKHQAEIKNQQNELKHQAEIKHQEEVKSQTEIKQNTQGGQNTQNTENNNTNSNVEQNTNMDAVVHKGEGVETVFIRQIENNPELAKELGYSGDVNDTQALHAFAGHEAHVIAIKEGYVDNAGHEIRVAKADTIAYEIRTENGHSMVDEKTIGGEILETHHEGDKFGEHTSKYEYNETKEHISTLNNNEHPAPDSTLLQNQTDPTIAGENNSLLHHQTDPTQNQTDPTKNPEQSVEQHNKQEQIKIERQNIIDKNWPKNHVICVRKI